MPHILIVDVVAGPFEKHAIPEGSEPDTVAREHLSGWCATEQGDRVVRREADLGPIWEVIDSYGEPIDFYAILA
jgi:hypothetical protein